MSERRPLYAGSGDPSKRRHDYYPWWLDRLAPDVTGEGAFMQGAAQGPDEIHAIVGFARELYEGQEFRFVGDSGPDQFVEDYTSAVRGQPVGVMVTVTRNEQGECQRLVVNHRPLEAVLLLKELMREKFAGTAMERIFVDEQKPSSS